VVLAAVQYSLFYTNVSKGPIDQASGLVNALRAERLMLRLNSPLNVDK
jgi:hypothetical protein